jgi:two-component system chemotaxis response regulator CheB
MSGRVATEMGISDPPTVAGLRVIAIAASAGGLRAYSTVLSALPRDFPAAVAAVQHLDRRHPSLMAQILARRTPLRVRQAASGDQLSPGTIYLAPPDQHLLVTAEGSLLLSHTEPVHFLRPSADLLFESVAESIGERAIAVVLTGTGRDGARGAAAIKRKGGIVLVQESASAEFPGMPDAAIATGSADLILPLAQIAPALVRLVTPGETP